MEDEVWFINVFFYVLFYRSGLFVVIYLYYF